MSGRAQKWLAEQLSVAPSTVQGYTKGKMPPADVALHICSILNIDIGWYITGVQSGATGVDHVVYVPVANHPEGEGAAFPYASSFVQHFGVPVDTIASLVMTGGLMEPTIPKGAEVLLTREVGSVEDGCLYALSVSGREIVRRLRVRTDGVLEAVCDNPVAQGDRLDEVDETMLTGRILWISYSA